MKYTIGDKVWWASTHSVEKWVTCPCCCGDRFITVITGDGKQHQIMCQECNTGGWDDHAMGAKKYYEYETAAKEVTINRIEVSGDKTEYGIEDSYRVEECNLFPFKDAADARCAILIQERNKASLEQALGKADHKRTWAWNTAYYRKKIKEAHRDIEYYTAKLSAAPKKKDEAA